MALWYIALASASPPGNDLNPGTIGAPRLTPNGAKSLLSPGDTLLARNGSYNDTITSWPSGTSWTTPIRFANYPGETVTLAGMTSTWALSMTTDEHYIEFDGINVNGTMARENTIVLGPIVSSQPAQPHHLRFKNATIIANSDNSATSGQGADGIQAACKTATATGGYEFINLIISGGGRPGSTNPDNGYGIYVSVPNCTIDGCDISDNKGAGVHCFNDDGAQPDNLIVRNSRIHAQSRFSVSGQAWGILIAASDCQVYCNLIYALTFADSNPVSAAIAVGGGSARTKIWNNSMYDLNASGVALTSGTTSTEIRNNLVYVSGGNAFQVVSGSPTYTSDHNMFSGVNPSFANASGGDFRITNASAAYHQGVAIPSVTRDFAGSPFHNPPSIGAYEVVEATGVWTRIAGVKAGSVDARATQTGEIDTTGANVLVVSTARYTGISATKTLTDSYGNVWIPLVEHNNANGIASLMYYAIASPTVGAAHTFLFADAGLIFPALAVEAWYCSTVDAFGAQNGSVSTSGSTLATGAVTSASLNSMFFAGLSFDDNSGNAVSIDSGFSANVQPLVFGLSVGAGIAFLAPPLAGSQNPTWNVGTTPPDGMAASILYFSSTSVMGGSGPLLALQRNRLVRTG